MKKSVWLFLLLFLGCLTVGFAQADPDDDEASGSGSAVAQAPAKKVGDEKAAGNKEAPAAVPAAAPQPATVAPAPTSAPAPAPETKPSAASPAGSARVVKVNLFLKNIAKFDPVMGKYSAEFEVEFKTPENTPAYNGEFDILGGRIVKKEEVESDDPAVKHFKVEAEIDLDLDFKRFPWDIQDLSFTLYNPEMNSAELKFEVEPLGKDESGMDEKVKVVGWDVEELEASISEDSFMEAKEKFSMYTFGLEIKRIRYPATMKVFFPLCIMIVIAFLCLFIGPANAIQRLQVLATILLAAVMFHLNASSAIPPIGYLTLTDKVFFCSYLSILLNLILTVGILKYNEYKLEDKVKSTFNLAVWLVPVLTIIGWGLVFLNVI